MAHIETDSWIRFTILHFWTILFEVEYEKYQIENPECYKGENWTVLDTVLL